MKFIDKEGRIGGKISVIDIIVIIICIVVVFAVFAKFHQGHTDASDMESKKITYTVEIQSIRQSSVDSFKTGDWLYLDSNGDAIGQITACDVKPAETAFSTDDGRWINGAVEGKYDLYLTVKADATENDGHVYVNRIDELNVNSDIKMCTKYVEFTGTITELNR